MYLLYETYDENTRILKELDFNTKILGLYENKDKALKDLKQRAEDTIIATDDKGEWFVKEEVFDEDNIIGAYRVFNEEIDNYTEFYTIILEKLEVKENE